MPLPSPVTQSSVNALSRSGSSAEALCCRAVLKDAAKTHSIQAGVDTTYEDFEAELKSKAEEQIQDVAEPTRYIYTNQACKPSQLIFLVITPPV